MKKIHHLQNLCLLRRHRQLRSRDLPDHRHRVRCLRLLRDQRLRRCRLRVPHRFARVRLLEKFLRPQLPFSACASRAWEPLPRLQFARPSPSSCWLRAASSLLQAPLLLALESSLLCGASSERLPLLVQETLLERPLPSLSRGASWAQSPPSLRKHHPLKPYFS